MFGRRSRAQPRALVDFLCHLVREEMEGERVRKAGHLRRERAERAIQRDELGGPAWFSFSHSA